MYPKSYTWAGRISGSHTVQFWVFLYKEDMDKLEQIQRRAIRMTCPLGKRLRQLDSKQHSRLPWEVVEYHFLGVFKSQVEKYSSKRVLSSALFLTRQTPQIPSKETYSLTFEFSGSPPWTRSPHYFWETTLVWSRGQGGMFKEGAEKHQTWNNLRCCGTACSQQSMTSFTLCCRWGQWKYFSSLHPLQPNIFREEQIIIKNAVFQNVREHLVFSAVSIYKQYR